MTASAAMLAQLEAELAKERNNAELWYKRGEVQRELGDMQGATQSFNQAMQLKPDFVEAAHKLARTLDESGQLLLAIQVYEHLLGMQPSHPARGRLNALRTSDGAMKLMQQMFTEANKLHKQRKLQEAEMLYKNVLVIFPDAVEAYSNLAALYVDFRRYKEAISLYQRALAIDAKYIPALNNLGNAYRAIGETDKAIQTYKMALKVDPNYAKSWINIGKMYQKKNMHDQALDAYSKALEIDPEHEEALAEIIIRRYHLCMWEGIERLKERLAVELTKPQKSAAPFVVALYCPNDTQLQNAKNWTQRFYPHGKAWEKAPLPADSRGDGKLRIGYLSADYHRNATAYLISELFEQHDRDQFEIYAYSSGADDGSAVRKRIVNAVESFRDVRLNSTSEINDLIKSDQIDILVDLKGYTINNRVDIMAARPAPVQVHYLGYPGTTGTCFIDYFIADAVSAPESLEPYFTEKLVRLPGSYQINDRNRPLPKGTSTRSDYGLPEEAFVFCDFNQLYKITPEVFACWMEILNAVPDSVLWLYESVDGILDKLKSRAEQAGVSAERIFGASPKDLPEHIDRYTHADLVLDTFPVCGHTTSSDALWSGIPVVALMGDNFASRVSAGLLHAVGLPELAVESLQDYKSLALELANDRTRIAEMKKHLVEKRMQLPLFDTVKKTRDIERAYLQMAALQRAGKEPESFHIDSE